MLRHHLDPIKGLKAYDRSQAMPTEFPEADDWAILDDPDEIADIAAASELQLRHVWPDGAVLSWHDVVPTSMFALNAANRRRMSSHVTLPRRDNLASLDSPQAKPHHFNGFKNPTEAKKLIGEEVSGTVTTSAVSRSSLWIIDFGNGLCGGWRR